MSSTQTDSPVIKLLKSIKEGAIVTVNNKDYKECIDHNYVFHNSSGSLTLTDKGEAILKRLEESFDLDLLPSIEKAFMVDALGQIKLGSYVLEPNSYNYLMRGGYIAHGPMPEEILDLTEKGQEAIDKYLTYEEVAKVNIPESRRYSDSVNNPKHYNEVPGVECIEVVRHFNFNKGNAMKYIWRAGNKDKSKEIEDLNKAIWYLQDEIKRIG